MQITRRNGIIAGSALALVVTGALSAGPAFARATHRSTTTTHTSTSVRNVDSSTATTGGQRFGGPMDGDGDHGRGMHGRGDFGPMGGHMLHGSGVAAQTDAAGKTTYVNVAQQEGTVVSASDTSLVVKSADGVQWTWTLNASTRLDRNGSSVKGSAFVAGDAVDVSGTGTGDGATAAFVRTERPRPPAGPNGSSLAPVPPSTTA